MDITRYDAILIAEDDSGPARLIEKSLTRQLGRLLALPVGNCLGTSAPQSSHTDAGASESRRRVYALTAHRLDEADGWNVTSSNYSQTYRGYAVEHRSPQRD